MKIFNKKVKIIMKRNFVILALFACFILVSLYLSECFSEETEQSKGRETGTVGLPPVKLSGDISVEEAIYKRISTRTYTNESLKLNDISQLLWAAGGKTIDGITGATRSYPSAGGIYPLEIYLVAGKVDCLCAGIYHYNWKEHSITIVKKGDQRNQLSQASLGQSSIIEAPVCIVITAVYSRTSKRYGKRGESRYVHMDMGGAGQNISLQAESLGLGTVIIGAFWDSVVKKVLGVKDEDPLYIMPVGRKTKN